MAKYPPAGKCVHCLKEFDDLTWDHLLPKSWYPEEDLSKIGKLKLQILDAHLSFNYS
ncbi:MAG: hypothetical protein AB1650_01530 [Candidatus Omnitrophota bacterium]